LFWILLHKRGGSAPGCPGRAVSAPRVGTAPHRGLSGWRARLPAVVSASSLRCGRRSNAPVVPATGVLRNGEIIAQAGRADKGRARLHRSAKSSGFAAFCHAACRGLW